MRATTNRGNLCIIICFDRFYLFLNEIIKRALIDSTIFKYSKVNTIQQQQHPIYYS